jgi:hypothetical protein
MATVFLLPTRLVLSGFSIRNAGLQLDEEASLADALLKVGAAKESNQMC